MKKEKVRVPYLTAFQNPKTPDIRSIRWASKYVEGNHTKVYANVIGLLAGLNPCAIMLLIYLIDVIDKRNYVRNTTELKNGFRAAIKKERAQGFSDTAINRAFKLMTEKKVLYRLHKKRGLYKVNPLYFFKGDEQERVAEIRIDLQRKNIRYINNHLAATYDEDMERKKAK